MGVLANVIGTDGNHRDSFGLIIIRIFHETFQEMNHIRAVIADKPDRIGRGLWERFERDVFLIDRIREGKGRSEGSQREHRRGGDSHSPLTIGILCEMVNNFDWKLAWSDLISQGI